MTCLLLAGPRAAADPPWAVAPLFGGDVRSLAFSPLDPDAAAAGTSAGQVYLSRDGGRSWREESAGQPLAGWVVGTLHFDVDGSGRLWAALWGVWGGGQVVSSEDLGATWAARSNGLPPEAIYALTTVPGAPGLLLAGTPSGVYGSFDRGASWRHLTGCCPDIVNVSSLLAHPEQPGTFIAGTWRRAYRSDDLGSSWWPVFEGMVLDTEVFSLHAVPGAGGQVWASTCGWVYKSEDGGLHWVRHREGFEQRRTPSFRVLTSGRLLAGTVAGLYGSADGGKSWQRRTDDTLSVLSIAHHPRNPDRVLLGTEGAGVWRSDDGGLTFLPSSNGITNLRISAVASAPEELLVAVAHAGPSSGIYRSPDGGSSFTRETVEVPTVLSLAVAADRAFAGTEKGLFVRRDGSWRPQAGLASERVEQVLASGDRVFARTRRRLFEARGDGFSEVAFHRGRPLSMAFFQRSLWVTDENGLYALGDGSNRAVSAPFPGGHLGVVGAHLLLAGKDGLWSRSDLSAPWLEHASGPIRLLATGEGALPVVTIDGGRAHLHAADGDRSYLLDPPCPPQDLLSAAIHRGRLFVGTSGYGLLSASLEELTDGDR